MSERDLISIGRLEPGSSAPAFGGQALLEATARFREPCYVVRDLERQRLGVAVSGRLGHGGAGWPVLGVLAPLYPEWLGDRSFNEAHGVRFAYVTGAMANGIATTQMVIAAAEAGMLGFFGAAGLGLERVEAAIDELEAALDHKGLSWGSNLIHSPQEPELEAAVVDLYLRRGVRRVSASAYMGLTPHVVRYAVTGLHLDAQGRLQRRNHLFAKISRPEVARHFMAPPPRALLTKLVEQGQITPMEAELATRAPLAEDIIVESDSGGHTDNQALGALFPVIRQLRDRLTAEHGFERPIRVGAAGGLGAPDAVAAAFSFGAAFVLTGSVNQSAVESGLSEAGRQMLARASLADVAMGAAADMFELGVQVQVLKRGTMFAVRANRLYELYQQHASLEAIPAEVMARVESDILRKPWQQLWEETRAWWQNRDPREVTKAEADPRHKMALCFRAYLGQSSRWAIAGLSERQLDYQIWCGPAMGAFNAWVEGSFLEPPAQRTVAQIGLNLLEGAAVVTRAHQLRSYGVPVPPAAFDFRPRPLR